MELIANILSVVGACLVLLAYFLVSTARVSPQGLAYLLINLIGAILILISLATYWNLGAFIIEVVWIVISIIGLARLARKK